MANMYSSENGLTIELENKIFAAEKGVVIELLPKVYTVENGLIALLFEGDEDYVMLIATPTGVSTTTPESGHWEVLKSTDGVTWTKTVWEDSPTSYFRQPSTTYGDGKIVNISFQDAMSAMVSEDNGQTFVEGTSIPTYYVSDITHGNGYFFAAGSYNVKAYSVDGINWTYYDYNASGNKFVNVEYCPDGYFAIYSNDSSRGVHWFKTVTERYDLAGLYYNSTTTTTQSAMVYGNGYLVAGTPGSIAYRADGSTSATFTRKVTDSSNTAFAYAAYGNGYFIVGYNNVCYKSSGDNPATATWTKHTLTSPYPTGSDNVVFFKDRFIGRDGKNILYSVDGINWTIAYTNATSLLGFDLITNKNGGYDHDL